ncbi:trypsin epsilon-like isoform X2 [Danaus plexippus]|nr:trypsin epsilon-like isoform X2 [Danaus plexippus]XP_061385168.1 trypsin epsilon-like isoform X2 [Danaus plexippus]
MLRLAISCSLALTVLSLETLEKNFEIVPTPSLSNIKCDKIIENLSGCYECYLCDEPKVDFKKKQGSVIHNLTLVDIDCQSTRICCFTQKDLIYRESDSRCGISYPEGYPIKVRSRLREVLDGQYPWRAWVYSKSEPYRPICAATYINYEDAALLAPAYCLHNKDPETLLVRFNKYGDDHYVGSISVHPEYNNGTHENDIALLNLRMKSSITWAVPACLPKVHLPFASTCVGVSDDNNFINFIVPKQSLCNETDPKLPNSLMCAVAPKRDYQQEYGSGLICLNDNVREPSYTVYGIMLERSGDSISLYTNISHFNSWIEEKITSSSHWWS